MGTCATCDVTGNEKKHEFEIKGYEFGDGSTTRGTGGHLGFQSLLSAEDVQKIIVIQSQVRKFIGQRNVELYKLHQLRSKRYFTKSEIIESKNRDQLSSKHVYSDGSVYIGGWKGNLRSGKGLMTWADGAKYEGYWEYGAASGKGKFTHIDGEVFRGLWRNFYVNKEIDKKVNINGYVWLVYKEKLFKLQPPSSGTPSIDSDWRKLIQDIKEQQDIIEETIASHQIEESKYVERRVSSQSYEDNSYYEGHFDNGRRDGIGKCTWPNGDSYTGEWKEDKITGWGTKTWKDGSYYTGFLLDNLHEGVGIYVFEDQSKYCGDWSNNMMNGQGAYYWPDHRSYVGQWLDGQMHGHGVLTLPGGRIYEGGWSHGKKHGEGLSFRSDGTFSRDIWKYGKIARPDI